jgi:hypothetical protein
LQLIEQQVATLKSSIAEALREHEQAVARLAAVPALALIPPNR